MHVVWVGAVLGHSIHNPPQLDIGTERSAILCIPLVGCKVLQKASLMEVPMTRSQVVAILSRVSSLETSQALELLTDSHESSLSMKEVLFVWDRISTCLDHQHAGDNSDALRQLEQLEQEFAAIGIYQILDAGE